MRRGQQLLAAAAALRKALAIRDEEGTDVSSGTDKAADTLGDWCAGEVR